MKIGSIFNLWKRVPVSGLISRQSNYAEPQPQEEHGTMPVPYAPEALGTALTAAAWNGSIADGLLRHQHLAANAEADVRRADATVLVGDLAEEVVMLEAEMEALLAQPAPAPAPRTVLGAMASIIPFSREGQHHA